MRNLTHKRGLRDRWELDGSSEQDRFRFREGWKASSSLSPESVECVSEGVADGQRAGGDGREAISGIPGDGGT